MSTAEIASSLGFPAALGGARIFLTGGTGFIGSALLRTFFQLQKELGWNAELVVLSRNPHLYPELAIKKSVKLIAGNLLDFPFPSGHFSHVVHCAGPTDYSFLRKNPEEAFSLLSEGTERVLNFSRAASASRFLYLSSGAVYAPGSERNSESDPLLSIADCSSLSAYTRGKIAAEHLCIEQGNAVRARCFTFSGEGLPLNKHYAIGNFVRDAARGGPVEITGSELARRSYLDSRDLSLWLWALLARGRGGEAYNVGSEAPITIGALAALVGKLGNCAVKNTSQRAASEEKPGSYLPDTKKARSELGLAEWTNLEDSVKTMLTLAIKKS